MGQGKLLSIILNDTSLRLVSHILCYIRSFFVLIDLVFSQNYLGKYSNSKGLVTAANPDERS